MHDQHYIDGKWIDCKSAIPFDEIKTLEKKQKEEKANSKLDMLEQPLEVDSPELNLEIEAKDNFVQPPLNYN